MCNLSKIERQTKESAAMPVAVAGSPKRTEQMFQALKRHILKERQKKKQEQEADAEVERQRKERELQQKQDVMTLGENREQITHLEQVLAQLRDEKHQLFLQLKKVLNEDDIRRRQLVRQHEPSSEVIDIYGGLYSGVSSMGGPLSHLVMPSTYAQPLPTDRNAVYKVPQTHTLLTASSIKRPRSPSPQPQMLFHQNYSPKPPPPQPRVTYQNVKHPLSDNALNNAISTPVVFPEPSSYSYYTASGGASGGSTSASAPQSSYGVYQGGGSAQYTGPGPGSTRNEQDTAPKQHPLYLSQQIARSSNISQGYIHGASLDHGKVTYGDEKYYPVSGVRGTSQVPVQGGGIPIQQPAQGAKTGGITSGYPIRPPTSHLPPPQTSNTSHSIYSSGVPPSSRLVYSQAGIPPSRYIQREV